MKGRDQGSTPKQEQPGCDQAAVEQVSSLEADALSSAAFLFGLFGGAGLVSVMSVSFQEANEGLRCGSDLKVFAACPAMPACLRRYCQGL